MPKRKKAEAPLPVRAARSACTAVAFSAAALALSVFLLIVVDYRSYREADPLTTPALEELRKEIRSSPGNAELREELRRFDLLARRAYFSSVDFRRRGALLLVFSVAAMILAIKGRRSLAPPPPVPGSGPEGEGTGASQAASRFALALTGVFTAGAALLLVLLFRPPAPPPAGGEEEGIIGTAAAPGKASAFWEERLEQWPSFRGPDGIGRAAASAFPVDWDGSEGKNVLWKTAVPRQGFSSPIVWGDRVFVTGGDEAAREIFCYDAATGDLVWRHDAASPSGAAALPEVTEDTGHAASTPATDGERVFAVFSTGDLVAVSYDGNRLWSRGLGLPDNPYGHSASLLVWRDLLIVQYDHRLEARVMALQASTGETVWEIFRDLDVSWSSPVLLPGSGGEALVLNGNPDIIAYDPSTGTELWRVAGMSGELAPSPAFGGGLLFAANEYARLVAVSPGPAPALAWEYFDDLPEVSSPVATEELLFMANGYGTVTCLDTRSGEVRWRQDFDEGFYASPIIAAGRVYLMDRKGYMQIFEADDEFRIIGRPALGESSTATGAFVDGRIYLRGEWHLFAIDGGAP